MEKTYEPASVEMVLSDQAKLDALVARIMVIEDITLGDPQKDYIVRYRGRLRSEDSAAAYDTLEKQLAPLDITPLFRLEDDRHVVLLKQGRIVTSRSNPWVNLVLFVLTLASVIISGGLNALQTVPESITAGILAVLREGLPFAVALLTILGTHEFGHYIAGRIHGVNVTLPYFIPLPLISPFGTMGAFINMKEPPKNRRQLLDIGLAGPLAGLIVAIPVTLIGLAMSNVDMIPSRLPPGQMLSLEGNSLLYLGLKYLVFGELLPAPAAYGDMPVWLYWLRFFFTGRPYPLGGMDVMLHPIAWAGWGGILVTALNLIPAGQLDGGHIMYTLVGRKTALRVLPFIIGAIALLGVFWSGWWIWVMLIFFLGRVHVEPLDMITPLDGRRRRLAVLAIILFLLVFTPVPLNIIG